MALSFTVESESKQTAARLGRVETLHGSFQTPAFMPVGTRGTVKGVTPRQLADTGAEIALNNTYHLLLRPGMEGVGKIEVDERRLIWIWTHKIYYWLRMFFWSWWP